MCFDFSQIFRKQIQEEGIYLRFKFDGPLHVQHDLGLGIGEVIDGGEGGPEDASALRADDEDIAIEGGLAHGQSAHWYYHIFLLPQHQEPFDWKFHQILILSLLC